MLHEKRDKTLQIRLSLKEWEDLHSFVSVNYGTKFTVSEYCRRIIMSHLEYEPFNQTTIDDIL